MIVSSLEWTQIRYPSIIVDRVMAFKGLDRILWVVPQGDKVTRAELAAVKRAAKEAGCTAEFSQKKRMWLIQKESPY